MSLAVGVILGIDAAWTAKNPSGFALAISTQQGWRLLTAASSYNEFHQKAYGLLPKDSFELPAAETILATAKMIAGHEVTLVSIDMPLARSPITSRRASDNAVSRIYGSRHCGTHTPSAVRPGKISDRLTLQFEQAGYPLRTEPFQGRGLIEVYPHPALVELTGAERRLPYKMSKIRNYWPHFTSTQRRDALIAEWSKITNYLERELSGVVSSLALVMPSDRLARYKAYEDALDAIVCAWVGICVLEGRAIPYGDADSAIWIPESR